MYAIFGSMNVKPEHVRAFREATIRVSQGVVSNEPGVFQFHILTDTDNPNRFYYFEIFRDEAAADAHWETENYKSWRATVEGMLDGGTQRISNMRTMFPSDQGLEKQKAGLLNW
jgi:quinol monooxygenase YgiN